MKNEYIALILAAGFGNRMKPLTNKNHKTLLNVAGETILERIINSLEQESITEIYIVTGYREKQIKDFINLNFPHLNISYIHNPRYRETNNIYSLALALENINIKKDLVLIESDLIYKKEVLNKLLNSDFPNAALVSKYSTGMDGTVVGIANEIITGVFPPHLHNDEFDFSNKYKTLNIYKFSREFCNGDFRKFLTFYSSMIDESCYYELILGIVIYMNRIIIGAVTVDILDWAEVDDPNDLSSAEFLFNLKDRENILEKSHGGFWNYPVSDYSYIRNFYYPTNSMFAHLRNSMKELIWNYGSSQEILNKKLAYLVGVGSKNIIALSGAAQIYPIIRNIFCEKKVCFPDITFGEYSRIFPDAIKYRDMFENGRTIEESIDQSDLIIIINPNNPSGSIHSTDKIYKWAKDNPKKYFLIDESFIEYSEEESILQNLEMEPRNNVIVLKSLSKSHGIPGIRLGFVYTQNEGFYKKIYQNLPIWNLNSFAENYMEIALKFRGELALSFQKAKKDRQNLEDLLNKINFVSKVYKSSGSFLTFRVDDRNISKSLRTYLITEHNIYLKQLTNEGLGESNFFRVALVSQPAIDKLIEALKEYLNSKFLN
tara:strand:+ start:17660 stop:19462 length:1803 start_codon:yes stop_codon:yes gene_type:complete